VHRAIRNYSVAVYCVTFHRAGHGTSLCEQIQQCSICFCWLLSAGAMKAVERLQAPRRKLGLNMQEVAFLPVS